MKFRSGWFFVLTVFASSMSVAQTFAEAVAMARQTDPQFSAAQAGVESRRMMARQLGGSYLPYVSAAYTQKDTSATASGSTTRTVTLTQPLISYDRYLSIQQSELYELQADAEDQLASADLRQRVFKVMAEIVRNREAVRVTQVQIDSVNEQLKRAVRLKELGQGTITDINILEVNLLTAQANLLGRQNALKDAETGFQAITGQPPRSEAVTLDLEEDPYRTQSEDALAASASQYAPSVRIARVSVSQAEIADKKNTAKYLPQVVAQAYRAQYSGRSDINASGIAVSLSLTYGVPQYYDQKRITSELVRAQESLRYAEQKVRLDFLRAYAAIRLRKEELDARSRAVDAATLSVDANTKSYAGGVKTSIDVMSSYRSLAEAEMAKVNALIAYREALLQLQLLLPQNG